MWHPDRIGPATHGTAKGAVNGNRRLPAEPSSLPERCGATRSALLAQKTANELTEVYIQKLSGRMSESMGVDERGREARTRFPEESLHGARKPLAIAQEAPPRCAVLMKNLIDHQNSVNLTAPQNASIAGERQRIPRAMNAVARPAVFGSKSGLFCGVGAFLNRRIIPTSEICRKKYRNRFVG